ncbi:MAG TPA: acylphosphatase [Deltaproteobacteria bacterium]|nr:acylphosphatase [Deltaproteobacteria bacterium]
MQVRAQIHGRVQGVFFRAWTQETAQRLGLKGWVRNCQDGSVELLAQGSKEVLEEFLQHCRQGPPAAQVSGVETEWVETGVDYVNFSVRY